VSLIYVGNVCKWDIQMIQSWNLVWRITVLIFILKGMCRKLLTTEPKNLGMNICILIYWRCFALPPNMNIFWITFAHTGYWFRMTVFIVVQQNSVNLAHTGLDRWLDCGILWILRWYLYWPKCLQVIFCYCSYSWANFSSFSASSLKRFSTLSLDAINNCHWSFCLYRR
jgi:hypothetical protein